ncbi:MAG: hypothetical protein HYR84_09535 [Planctomycetes bacterium]|nr:hypothetical protein [Planctomycetota bacterium]
MRFFIGMIGSLFASPAMAQPATELERAADEAILRDHKLPTRGPQLLQILRDHTPSADAVTQFKKHVARLKSANYTDRLKATADLAKIGPRIRPLLENLLQDIKADAETIGRLRSVAEKFSAEKDIAVTSAAARLIAREKPANALPVLLDFVPYAPSESVRQEVQQAINAMALVGKAPAPLLVAALKDADPARRAAAGEAILRGVGIGAVKQIEHLLADGHPLVRFQIGKALVEKNDKRGMPLLIQTLNDVSVERAECALDLLYRAAGENAPNVSYAGKHTAPAVCAAWQKWHEQNAAGLDLAKQLARTELGFTIIATAAVRPPIKSKIFEIGPGATPEIRWEFDAPRNTLDVQILGPNRLLLAEYFERRVTERDFKGNILRQFQAPMPVGCQRLPGGQTFIVCRSQLLILDADGKDVFSWFPNASSISAAQRLPNGNIAVVTSASKCLLLDAQGRELKSFQMGGTVYPLGGSVEVLANGRILVALYLNNNIVEFDWTGHRHWEAKINHRPSSATRLGNGNTLVACVLDPCVIELDRAGKEVWSYRPDGRPVRVRRR